MYDSESLANMGKYRVRFSGGHEAIYDYDAGKRYTYSDMDKRSDKLAWFLTEKMGLKKGDRIGFCATNSVAFFDAFFATYKTGIIISTGIQIFDNMSVTIKVKRFIKTSGRIKGFPLNAF